MRKHFLLLFLMALLPLAGWADDPIVVKVAFGDSPSSEAFATAISKVYDGATVPTVSIKAGNIDITSSTDYTKTWTPALASTPGTYTLNVTKTGSTFTAATLTITPYDISGFVGTLSVSASAYNGSEIDQPVVSKISHNSTDIASSATTLTIVSWQDANGNPLATTNGRPKDAGVYTALIQAGTGYAGTATATYQISKIGLTVTALSFVDGDADTQHNAITFGDALPASSYGVAFDGFVNGETQSVISNIESVTFATQKAGVAYEAGHATKGAAQTYDIIPTLNQLSATNYIFSPVNGTITVKPRDVNTSAISITDIPSVLYTGQPQTPATVEAKYVAYNYDLVKTNDYTLSYSATSATATDFANTLDMTNAGTYYVKVTGVNNFKGSVVKEFTINKRPLKIQTVGTFSKVYDAKTPVLAIVVTEGATQNVVTEGLQNSETLAGIQHNPLSTPDDGLGTLTLKLSTENAVNQGTYTIKVSGDKPASQMFKNYMPTYVNTGSYTINKRKLNIKINDGSRAYDEEDPFDQGVRGASYITITDDSSDDSDGLVAEGTTAGNINHTIATYPLITKTATATVNHYELNADESIVINQAVYGSTDDPVAVTDNYDVVYTPGSYVVQTGQLAIIPNDINITYGQDVPTPSATIAGLLPEHQTGEVYESLLAQVNNALNVNKSNLNAGTYNGAITVDLTKVTLPAAWENMYSNTFTAFTGKLKIDKRRLTKITVKAQTLNTTDLVTALKKGKDFVEFEATGYEINPDDYARLESEYNFAFAGSASTASAATFDKGIRIAFVSTTNKFKNFDLPIKTGTTEISLDTEEDGKYTFGKLTVTVADNVTLLSQTTFANTEKDPATVLSGANNKKVTVKFGAREIKKEVWTPMVLPFATNVKEISNALGYAVVDLMEAKGDGNVHFTLHLGDIPANTPFIVKAYENCNLAGVGTIGDYNYQAPVEVAGKTIDFTTNINTITKNAVVSDGDIEFIGVYSKNTGIYGLNSWYCSSSTGVWNYPNTDVYTESNKMIIPTMKAYLQFPAGSGARMIYIQEPDGSTTAISAVAFENEAVANDGWYTLNGVKLQGAPTEKGVYINNGKKVVIK